jgi:aryl-alcohol dehydrogenase-like predicted oxidoreductase
VAKFLGDPAAVARLDALRAVAEKHRATPAQVAIAWQLRKPFVTTPIASATSAAQVQELVTAVRLELDADDMSVLDEQPRTPVSDAPPTAGGT